MEGQKMSAPRKSVFSPRRIKGLFKKEEPHLQISSMDSDTSNCYSGSKSDSDFNGGIVLTFDAHWNTPSCAIADSTDLHLLQWATTAKRGRKSLSPSTSTSTLSCSSLFAKEKQVEPVLGDEKEAAETLCPLADRCSEDSTVSSINFPEKERIAEFPDSEEKRKTEDANIDCTKDFSMNAGIEKETKNSKVEIIFDILNLDGTKNKQIPKVRCDNCGRSFSSSQALGGHKSNCKKNASTSVHDCKLCDKSFLSGHALGGHQRKHQTGQVKPRFGSCLSLLAPNEEVRKESLSRNYCLTSSVQDAQDEVVTNKKRKVMLFGVDLSENLPESMDESTDLRL